MRTKPLFFLLLFCLLISGCRKKTERLLIGIWQVTKIEFSLEGGPFEEVDLGCNEEDSWIFYKDGTYKIVSGLVLCGDGNPSTGTWWLDDTESIINITTDGYVGSHERKIIQLDRKNLVTEHDLGTNSTSFSRFHYKAL